jgi:hypothetical protein
MDNCPKCGARIVKRWTGKSSRLPRWAYLCGTEWTGKHYVYSIKCLCGQLDIMTARAEKAEAERDELKSGNEGWEILVTQYLADSPSVCGWCLAPIIRCNCRAKSQEEQDKLREEIKALRARLVGEPPQPCPDRSIDVCS